MNSRDNVLQQKVLRMCERCELCGSMRNLEVHHIIPLVIEIEEIDLNCEENLLVVCKKCHAMLTPHRLLTKIGQKNTTKKIGRKKGETFETKKSKEMKKIILDLSIDFRGTKKDTELLKITELARGTYYKYKRELKEQGF